ncbi:PAS domain-containing sensor histidine kinase [Hahella sp. HN01]|nr:PAS domain-containing sensor histidine kinase [Hahella sp. HN01]
MLQAPRMSDLSTDVEQTTNRLFRVYNHYRVTVGIILVSALYLQNPSSVSQYLSPFYFEVSVICYLAIHVFTGFLLLAGFRPEIRHAMVSVVLELLLISAMLLFGTGVSSGLGNMVVISVAAGNIILRGQLGTLLAAIASLGVVSQEIYRMVAQYSDVDNVFRAGILGVVYFATALLVKNLSIRIATTENLARKRAQNILELERLNHQIIQRMLTGIIVADENGGVRMANQAAQSLLNVDETHELTSLPEDLLLRLQEWQEDPSKKTTPFRGSAIRAPIQANFAILQKEEGQDILIFLEDTGKIAQQAQQLKLASLGRLTAGIAHEIRNPLGAASHAAQLLLESHELTPPDKQMAEIILRHATRMNGIIENVLSLSRRKISSPQMLTLIPWLTDFVCDYTAAGTRDAEIEILPLKDDIHGRFDPNHLNQILNNLVGNGLRYSKLESARSWVKLVVGEIEETGQAFIDVIDIGPGIKEEQLNHLFEPFFTTDPKGTGLGLYLSKELCEANQAQLDYLTRQEGGGCFRITFPHPKRAI